MKNIIITFAFIILALFLAKGVILGDTNSIKAGADSIGESLVTEMNSVLGNGQSQE